MKYTEYEEYIDRILNILLEIAEGTIAYQVNPETRIRAAEALIETIIRIEG